MIWLTLNDEGYRVIRADTEPNNAVRGPYSTQDEAMAALDREELAGVRALAALIALFAGVALVAGGWMVIQAVAR